MPKPLIEDELWSIIEPLLPRRRKRPKRGRGRPRVGDRAALTGIVFVLRSGIPWKMLPREMGCGSGVTCWRRLKAWQRTGVWKRLHQVLLSKLRQAERIDFSRAVADSSSIRALGAGKKTGPNPTDHRRSGSKHHLLIDSQGIPLSVILTQANRHDVTQLLPLVQAIPPIGGKRGAPRRKPKLVQADRAYDSDPHRAALLALGIQSQIARRRTRHGSGLGKTRWVVERTIAWLHWLRRLRIRCERLPSIHEAFLKIGCCLICWRFLQNA